MGWIAQFLSRAVVTGFLFGAAIDVVIGELPKLTGTAVTGTNPLQELRSWLGTLDDIHRATLLVGAAALAVVFGLRAIRAGRAPARWFSSSADSSDRGCSISALTAWLSSARCRGVCRRQRCRIITC